MWRSPGSQRSKSSHRHELSMGPQVSMKHEALERSTSNGARALSIPSALGSLASIDLIVMGYGIAPCSRSPLTPRPKRQLHADFRYEGGVQVMPDRICVEFPLPTEDALSTGASYLPLIQSSAFSNTGDWLSRKEHGCKECHPTRHVHLPRNRHGSPPGVFILGCALLSRL